MKNIASSVYRHFQYTILDTCTMVVSTGYIAGYKTHVQYIKFTILTSINLT